jgi:hypothetical protein
MTRAMVLLLLGIVAFALVATPGLGAVGLLVGVFVIVAFAWWVALGAGRPGTRTSAVVRIRQREFLGPGGPDDPFADEPVEADAERTHTEHDQRLGRDSEPLGGASSSAASAQLRRPS